MASERERRGAASDPGPDLQPERDPDAVADARPDAGVIHLALPKGRTYDGVVRLLGEAGVGVLSSVRGYRPTVGLPNAETKVLKPRAVVEMLAAGTRDLGFAGADWVAETGADVVELLDTGLDPVRLVAAAPPTLLVDGRLPATGPGGTPLRVASEYVELTGRWLGGRGVGGEVVRSYGATEVLPPEDADLIVDNTATGSTLSANGLVVVDELMRSSTRLYASRRAMDDRVKRQRIEDFAMLVRSVLEARARATLEVNVTRERLEELVAALPCMREPTVAPLHGSAGYAVKAAVPRADLHRVIPRLKACGGTDIIVSTPQQIVV